MESRISLGLYALVNTSLQAGIPEAAVLAAAGLGQDEWQAESAVWSRIISGLLDDDDPESHALDALDAEVLAARDRLARTVEPLDTDVAAWLAFEAAMMNAPDPEEFAALRGLTTLDMMRIGVAWTRQMSKDADLRSEALRCMQRSDSPVPEIRVAPWPLEAAFAGLRAPATPGTAVATPPAADVQPTEPSPEDTTAPLWTALPGKDRASLDE